MEPRKILLYACVVIFTASLMAGFGMVSQTAGAGASLIPAAILLVAHRWKAAWLATAALVLGVVLAAIGILTRGVPVLMMAGCIGSLAAWDLAILDISLAGSLPDTVRRLEQNHLQALGIALGLSLVLLATGKLIHFQIPFGIVVVLVILGLFGLDRVIRYFWAG